MFSLKRSLSLYIVAHVCRDPPVALHVSQRISSESWGFSEKSTLWTYAGADQNFQRDLGIIGPYEFQGKFVWTNLLVPRFQGKSVWTNGPESSQKSSPRLAVVHGLALPNSSGVAIVSRYIPSQRFCCTCRPSTARGVKSQAASEKVPRYRGV